MSATAVRDAEADFVHLAPAPQPLPNIVVMFAESTSSGLRSAYTASSDDDLYLRQNLAVFRDCGSEVLSSVPSEGVRDLKPRTTGAQRYLDCADAYRSRLASIRRSGLF